MPFGRNKFPWDLWSREEVLARAVMHDMHDIENRGYGASNFDAIEPAARRIANDYEGFLSALRFARALLCEAVRLWPVTSEWGKPGSAAFILAGGDDFARLYEVGRTSSEKYGGGFFLACGELISEGETPEHGKMRIGDYYQILASKDGYSDRRIGDCLISHSIAVAKVLPLPSSRLF